jgi:ribosomal protein S12 methylthiotransferase
VLVDHPGEGRSHREAPEIDGVVQVSDDLPVGTFQEVLVVDALGPDLVGVAV